MQIILIKKGNKYHPDSEKLKVASDKGKGNNKEQIKHITAKARRTQRIIMNYEL
jgi:hypothetical protein